MKLKIYELDNIKDEVLKMTKYYIDQLPIPEKLKSMLFNESFFYRESCILWLLSLSIC